MKSLPGNMRDFVELNGFVVIDQIQEADLCIIDHYEIDEKWEISIRPFVKKIMVIDDLANRKHDCDLILDQNLVPQFENRYDHLVPIGCKKLLGPSYLIMREEFVEQRQKVSRQAFKMERLLIFMGGSDPTNETEKVLCALKNSKQQFKHVDVVVGNSNLRKEFILNFCKKEGWHYHCQIDYLALLMAKADFSIGAGGSTTWERCYVGLPSSSTIVADNQKISTETAASLEIVINLGWHENVTTETYSQLLLSLRNREQDIMKMSQRGFAFTDSPYGPNPWIKDIMELTL
jgi:UDP-2,4-diacetamido-2,4,6-trideoxy-beta-L-altropyranose hydrolase